MEGFSHLFWPIATLVARHPAAGSSIRSFRSCDLAGKQLMGTGFNVLRVGTCALAASVIAASTAAGDAPRFNRDVRPILSDKCFACHGPDAGSRQAELRLDVREEAIAWAITPGDADESEVLSRVVSKDPELRMPPAGSKKPLLTQAEIETLRKWIDSGAEYEPHWAYVPPVRSELPIVKQSGWVRNPIDQFVLARQESTAIAPAAEADKTTLVRRVYLDLTGLPPTPAQVDEFLQDDSSTAHEKLVDKLLASPAYGERMASWWFDLVRFANTVGYHGDQEQRVTPYRDYVIKSFNDNLSFDQFTIEQLAGDLLPNPTMWQRIATGYNRLLQSTHEGGAQDAEYRAIQLADHVRNFSEVWLAASLGCAQCHDHKFDPYTTKDFYRLEALFADVDHHGSYERIGADALVTQRPPEILAWTLPIYEECQKLDDQIAKLESELSPYRTGWEKKRKEIIHLKEQRLALEAKFVPTLVTEACEPPTIRVLPRGNWLDKSGEVATPQTPGVFEQLDDNSGRPTRLDLAKWVVNEKNPLASRVVVNRLWHRYFGVGLSKLLIDTGSQGETPSHPELLDWLAVDFRENGWDVKRLVRMMVTSSTYRQSSFPRPEAERADPENRLLTRQARPRLDAEQIRDAALVASGLLVRQVGGDVIRPYQPAGYYKHLNFPERDYHASGGAAQFRRAVYVHWQRQYVHPWLVTFDAPSREECCAQRAASNTPSGALVLLNDPSFVEAARGLATLSFKEFDGDDEARVRWLWRQVLSRQAETAEVAPVLKLLAKHRKAYEANPKDAEALLAIGISPKPADVNAGELASWTSVCRVLLNLSEAITRN